MLKTTTLAMLATLAAGAALAQDASPIDDAIAGCAAGVAAPADAGTALEAKGFTKAEADGATTYTNGTVTVTLTTEPAGCAVSDTATRTHLPPPSSETSQNTAATTTAQFAPDTAVRWLRPEASIASFSCSDTARVSPTARPGSSPAPGSGRRTARRTNSARAGGSR